MKYKNTQIIIAFSVGKLRFQRHQVSPLRLHPLLFVTEIYAFLFSFPLCPGCLLETEVVFKLWNLEYNIEQTVVKGVQSF